MAFHIKIGNYRFSKNLGTGSFGKVKLAFNDVTGHKVAIKILNKKKIKQQGVFEKVKREIKVLRQFNHPHIIKHYEFIDTPSDIFMVIEFASGGELFDLISRRERLPEDEARRFFQQIYSSIEYTHAHKIAHRDLKPENLLLDEYNNIKLIDFGLANSMKDSQALKTACGSPNYAAPEVISGRSYGGVEVDVWSLGVILFAMVCGSLPFDDDSMSSLFSKIKEGKYYMPNYISTEVKDLINRMLQPNPVKRITMREIKDHPWYLKDLPQYLQNLSDRHAKPSSDVDMDIVRRLFTLNLNLAGRTEEEIVKAIKDKKNTDFCGIYELYNHDKMKKECFKIQHQNDDDPFGSTEVVSSKMSTSSANPLKKHFKTVKHLLMSRGDGSRTPSSTTVIQNVKDVQTNYSLLSQKHQERLSRIIKKFRTGDQGTRYQQLLSPIKEEKKEVIVSRSGRAPSEVSTLPETGVMSGPVVLMQRQSSLPKQNNLSVEPQYDASSQLFIQRKPQPKSQRWVFGLNFKGAPVDLMSLACEVLQLLEIEWQIIPKDLKLKCRSKIDENSVNEYEQSLLMDGGLSGEEALATNNKDEMIKEFLRKNFLKFYINIYKDQPPVPSVSSRSSAHHSSAGLSGNGAATPEEGSGGSSRYMLDIHLFKGTLYVFMDFVRKFMHVITASCSLCSGNSCCSSSNHSSIVEGARFAHHHDYNLKIFI